MPCGMSDGSKRERNNTRIMGVIDFGVVAVSNERYRRVAVLNPNPTPVTMTSVVSTVRAVRVTRVEVSGAPLDSLISPSVSDAALRVSSVFRPLPPPEGCLTNEGKMAACEQAFVGGGERVAGVIPYGKSPATIPPNHVAVIDVRAAPKKEELAKMGGMLSFSFDNGRSLVAPVVLRALRGDISVVAGGVSGDRGDAAGGAVDATLELPPAFPGRPSRALLKLKSTFAEHVTVAAVSSSDPAVRLDVLSTKLKPGREVTVGEVVFDPARLPPEKAYTGLDKSTRAAARGGAFARGDGNGAPPSGDAVGFERAEPTDGAPPAEGSKGRARPSRGFLTRILFGGGGADVSESAGGADAFGPPAARKSRTTGSAVSSVRMLTLDDVAELRRQRAAWLAVTGMPDPEGKDAHAPGSKKRKHAAGRRGSRKDTAGGGSDASGGGASAAAEYSATLSLQMDAVDETSVAVRARLVRPRILLFAGEDEGDEEREGNAPELSPPPRGGFLSAGTPRARPASSISARRRRTRGPSAGARWSSTRSRIRRCACASCPSSSRTPRGRTPSRAETRGEGSSGVSSGDSSAAAAATRPGRRRTGTRCFPTPPLWRRRRRTSPASTRFTPGSRSRAASSRLSGAFPRAGPRREPRAPVGERSGRDPTRGARTRRLRPRRATRIFSRGAIRRVWVLRR